MRTTKVPIDMSSEQKEIMGVVSKRQMLYLAVGSILIYSYVPVVYNFFSFTGWLFGLIAAIFSALPVLFIIGVLGFAKVGKLNMNRDYYYLIKLQRKSQYGSWRKGRDV